MTIEYIKEVIEDINDNRTDIDVAHQIEDQLRQDFLTAIVNNKYKSIEELKEVAKEVLRSNEIITHRWYA